MGLVQVQSCGCTFRVLDPERYPFGSYEFTDEADIKAAYWSDIGPDEVVMDLGASWGGYALPALAQGARVIAVEPSLVSRVPLNAAVIANGWKKRAVILAVMLWDDSPIPESFFDSAVRNVGGTSDVPVRTLDMVAAALNLPRLDRIKFDVEGAELPILRGGRKTLQRFHPRLLIEDHDRLPDAPDAAALPFRVGLRDAVLAELHALGYRTSLVETAQGNPFIVAEAS